MQAEEDKKAAEALHKAEEEKLAAQKVEEARLAAPRRRSYRCTLASIPEEEIIQQEHMNVEAPFSTTQVEIVHLPTIIPNDPSLGIVSPMTPDKRRIWYEVYRATFPSCQRIII